MKIESARAELWRYPLPGVTGGSGITSVDVIVVDLEGADGTSGTGFSYVLGGGGDHVAAMAQTMLDRFVTDQEIAPPQTLWRKLAGSLNRTGRGSGYVAIAAIDVAAWDLHAKRMAVPLGVAMGGEARTLPVYGSGGFGPTQDPDAAAEQAVKYADTGCSAVKLRFAGNHADIVRLDAVRKALPADVGIMADTNEKCDLATAQWLINGCSDYNLMWLEEPLPADDVLGYQALARTSSVPIATGEHHQGLVELTPFFEGQSCAIVQPDLAMMGGLTEALRVATVAEHHGITVAPHFLPSLFIHVAAAAPSVKWMEHFPLLEPLFDDPVDIDAEGKIAPRNVPGHGMVWADGARAEFQAG